jgi:ribonuclease E
MSNFGVADESVSVPVPVPERLERPTLPNENAPGDRSTAEGTESAARRRGSRGGRRRKKPNSTTRPLFADGENGPDSNGPDSNGHDRIAADRPSLSAIDRSELDARPADMPDSPREGVPSPEAAARAEVRPRRRPNQNQPAQNQMEQSQEQSQMEQGQMEQNPPDEAESGMEPTSGGVRPRNNSNRNRKRNGDRTPKTSTEADPTNASDDASIVGDVDRTQPLLRPGAGAKNKRRDNRDNGGPSSDRQRRSRRRGTEEEETNTVDVRKGRERNGRPVGRFLMCVHKHPKATQIAVLEGRALTEHYVSRPTDNANQIFGNIYLGRVQNVLPGMEAAFVDIGTPKNAVLYRGDIAYDASDMEGGGKGNKPDVKIEQLLKNRQLVLCQVTKNPIGSKGARLTQDVSLPGRFVVLVPNSETYGISKRLPDDERRRLRRILDVIRPAGHGLIVRTAAEGATAEELERDVALLLKLWATIEAKRAKANGPMLLHQEPDMAVRVIREEFNGNYRGIVIDDRELYEEIRLYVESISPELADRVEFHDTTTEPLPLYEKHHIHEQLHKAIDRKVWLPSGGSLIIERTEALTVIDVNTGKNVGSSSLEETVFRNNLEAGDEIARQLRLRDIGGIIVIDFIDMETRANRDAVIRAFRDALARDKTRTQVFDISELGLVEMTRKRISEGLVESLSEICPSCGGRGFTFDDELIQ